MNPKTYRATRGFSYTLRSMNTATEKPEPKPTAAISVAEIIAKSPDPIEAIKKLGEMLAKSQMLGPTERVEIGQVAVLLCATQGMTIGDLLRTHHIQFGKLAKIIDAALGEFIKGGGSVEWIEDGSNRTSAKAKFRLGAEEVTISCTVEEAAKAGWTRNQKWTTEPTSMLRARVKKNGVRALAPWIFAGEYEADDVPQVAIEPARAVEAMAATQAPAPRAEVAKVQQSPAVAPQANGGPVAGSVAQGSATSAPPATAAPAAAATLSHELQTQLLAIIQPDFNVGQAQAWLQQVCWLLPDRSIDQLAENYAKQLIAKPDVFRAKLAKFVERGGK